MLKSLYINKNYLLAFATVLILLLCYQLALKNTIAAYQLNKRLKAQINDKSVNVQPLYLARQSQALTSILLNFSADTNSYRNKLSTKFAELAEKQKVTVIEVPAIKIAYSDKILTQKIVLRGPFRSLTKTLYQCEAQKGFGLIRSVNFKAGIIANPKKDGSETEMEITAEAVK